MIATIKVGNYQGLVQCNLFDGNIFNITWVNFGSFPKHWHDLYLCHKNHIKL